MPHERNRFDRLTTRHRLATDYEFLDEPDHPPANVLMNRIDEMRQELNDAMHSTRTLIALNRLALEEMTGDSK